MRRIVLSCIVLIAFVSCNNGSNTSEIQVISAQEMLEILEVEDVQLVDVRTPKEYDVIHIVNSQNIDFNSPTFDADITKLDKTKPVVLYCKSGNRSAKCAKKLQDAGFEKIYDLDGGISKWQHSEILEIEIKS